MSYKETFEEYTGIAKDNSLTEQQKIDKIREKFTIEEISFKKKNVRKLNKRIKKELNIEDDSIDLFIDLYAF